MSTRTFQANLGSSLDANWIAARRLVDAFAPHESAIPEMRVVLDPGHLLVGNELIEVGTQSVVIAGLAAPPSAFRIDRICIDRLTGAAVKVVGTPGQLAPPNLPGGVYPCARVLVTGGVPSITNEAITDERSLSGTCSQEVTCRLELADDQAISPTHNTPNKVHFTGASIDVGAAFVGGGFKPATPGRYSVSARVAMFIPPQKWRLLRAFLYVNGAQRSVLNAYMENRTNSSDEVYATVQITDTFELDGTQTVELYASHADDLTTSESRIDRRTVMMAHRLGS